MAEFRLVIYNFPDFISAAFKSVHQMMAKHYSINAISIIMNHKYIIFSEEITCDEEFDQRWITVFGFPPSASSYILSQFSQYGDIIKHKVKYYRWL